jgi:hypothetical protein
MLEIMESKRHGLLEGSSNIFETKRHLMIGKCTPWIDESYFVLVFKFDLYPIISRKTIHERKILTTDAFINYLVNEWCGKIIFWIGFVQITKICTYTNCALFHVDRHRI